MSDKVLPEEGEEGEGKDEKEKKPKKTKKTKKEKVGTPASVEDSGEAKDGEAVEAEPEEVNAAAEELPMADPTEEKK